MGTCFRHLIFHCYNVDLLIEAANFSVSGISLSLLLVFIMNLVRTAFEDAAQAAAQWAPQGAAQGASQGAPQGAAVDGFSIDSVNTSVDNSTALFSSNKNVTNKSGVNADAASSSGANSGISRSGVNVGAASSSVASSGISRSGTGRIGGLSIADITNISSTPATGATGTNTPPIVPPRPLPPLDPLDHINEKSRYPHAFANESDIALRNKINRGEFSDTHQPYARRLALKLLEFKEDNRIPNDISGLPKGDVHYLTAALRDFHGAKYNEKLTRRNSELIRNHI